MAAVAESDGSTLMLRPRAGRGLAAIASTICATAGMSAGPVQPKIGQIVLGQARSEVESLLGRPPQAGKIGGAGNIEMRYPGFTLWFGEDGRVSRLRSTNPRHCLADKVCPGASLAILLARLGSPQQGPVVRSGTVTYLLPDKCWAEITLEGERVSAVDVRCQP